MGPPREAEHIPHSLCKTLQHQLTEAAGESFDRQEEPALGGDPPFLEERQTAAGNDAVEVRMEVHILAPTMEDPEEAEFHSETFGRGEEERLGGGAEEDSVDDFFVVEGEGSDLLLEA